MAVLRRRVLLIVNPASRRGRRVLGATVDAFRAEGGGVECVSVVTARPGHAAEIAVEQARDYDVVFTLGGDGTVMEVVGALAHTGQPIGVLAGGTGNLIARALRIPFNVRRAVRVLLAGDIATIDLGVLSVGGGRRFAVAAGVGIDATMVARTPTRLKRLLGVGAYVLVGSRTVLRHERFTVRATIDGVTHTRAASAVMVANFGTVLGHLLTLGPGIKQDDGLLDLCIFSPETLADAVRIAWQLVRHDFRSDPHLLYAAGRSIRVETDPPLPMQADGDVLGTTPFTATVEPLAAKLLVPKA